MTKDARRQVKWQVRHHLERRGGQGVAEDVCFTDGHVAIRRELAPQPISEDRISFDGSNPRA
jgi:hypothetical protein